METFVDRLVLDGLLVCDPVVGSALQGELTDLSPRTIQRRIIRSTGSTQATIYQIQRARYAMDLRTQSAILETLDRADASADPVSSSTATVVFVQDTAHLIRYHWQYRIRASLVNSIR